MPHKHTMLPAQPNLIVMKHLLISSVVKNIADWGFTASEIAFANRALICSVDQIVMMAWGGAIPTALIGTVIKGTHTRTVVGHPNISTLKFIVQGSDSNVMIVLESI